MEPHCVCMVQCVLVVMVILIPRSLFFLFFLLFCLQYYSKYDVAFAAIGGGIGDGYM